MGIVGAQLHHGRGRWQLLLHCRHEHTGELPHHQRGHPISVSLCLAAPPEGSRVCVVQRPAAAGVEVSYGVVVAAHGDSVVVQVGIEIENHGYYIATRTRSADHFVYSAGDAAAEPPRPPSLSLLPPHSVAYEHKRRPECNLLGTKSTGLLCRGDGDFLVAELQMEFVMEKGCPVSPVRKDAALHLLRSGSGSGEWYVKRPAIIRHATGGECVDESWASWQTSIVIPVGDQMLCWVDLARGLLFSDDMFGESHSLRYVPLPEDDPNLGWRGVCVTGADGSTVKVVNVFPRCCCGSAGKSCCAASHHAYAVRTWTLRMHDDDGMTWAMDGCLDATQLWSLNSYNGLPRVELDNPIVSMDEPDTICFEVCDEKRGGNFTLWSVMVDMKSKTLRSVFRYPDARRCSSWWDRHLPSRVSKYFNTMPSITQSSAPDPAAQAEEMQNLMLSSRMIDNKMHAINNTTTQAASPEAAVLTALQEIPGLDRDDMLKAYRILAHDDSGRRFRALMGLPIDLSKDCVLMEIKASEACVLCSVLWIFGRL